jgi:hypothetical protein
MWPYLESTSNRKSYFVNYILSFPQIMLVIYNHTELVSSWKLYSLEKSHPWSSTRSKALRVTISYCLPLIKNIILHLHNIWHKRFAVPSFALIQLFNSKKRERRKTRSLQSLQPRQDGNKILIFLPRPKQKARPVVYYGHCLGKMSLSSALLPRVKRQQEPSSLRIKPSEKSVDSFPLS